MGVDGGLEEWAGRFIRPRPGRPSRGCVRFAFYGRVSTEDWQDPTSSLARQREQAGALVCGHGTIGVATVLVECGMVAVTEPETVIRLDTPAGLVEVRVAVADGRADRVTLRNVPAFVAELDAGVEVDGLGARLIWFPGSGSGAGGAHGYQFSLITHDACAVTRRLERR